MDINAWDNFLRPSVCVYLIAVYVMGMLASGFFGAVHIAGAAAAALLCFASITTNHYFDREYDKKSSQLYRFPVAKGAISPFFAKFFSLILMLVPVAIAFFFLGYSALYLVIFGVFVVVSYSAPPLRMKIRPVLGLLWNGIGYGLLPFYLALLVSGVHITMQMRLFSLVPFLVAMSGHVLLQIRDISDDKKAGIRTTSTKLGGLPALKLAKVMPALAGVIVLYLAAVNFLNILAYASVIVGILAILEYRKMKSRMNGRRNERARRIQATRPLLHSEVEQSYGRLKYVYIISGILLMASMISL